MKITIANIMEKHPCEEYPLERIREIANGRESMELSDALDLDIPHADRIWLITRFLSDRSNRLFAADVAEHDVARRPEGASKNISMALIARVRDYADGRITAEELQSYRYADADDAYYAAAEAAAAAAAAYYANAVTAATYYAAAAYANAAANAANAAAHDATYNAAYTAACAWQLDRLRFYVDEMEVI